MTQQDEENGLSLPAILGIIAFLLATACFALIEWANPTTWQLRWLIPFAWCANGLIPAGSGMLFGWLLGLGRVRTALRSRERQREILGWQLTNAIPIQIAVWLGTVITITVASAVAQDHINLWLAGVITQIPTLRVGLSTPTASDAKPAGKFQKAAFGILMIAAVGVVVTNILVVAGSLHWLPSGGFIEQVGNLAEGPVVGRYARIGISTAWNALGALAAAMLALRNHPRKWSFGFIARETLRIFGFVFVFSLGGVAAGLLLGDGFAATHGMNSHPYTGVVPFYLLSLLRNGLVRYPVYIAAGLGYLAIIAVARRHSQRQPQQR
jgi:hypothetical protein